MRSHKIILSMFFSLLGCAFVSAQVNGFKTDEFVYWQPNVQIEFADFAQQADSEMMDRFKKLWISSWVTVQIQVVMDEPQRIRGGHIKSEKVYIAPVFCIKRSCQIGEMDRAIEYAKIQMDIAEWCARQTRKRIKDLHKIKTARGLVKDSLPAMVDEMYESMNKLLGAFSNQVMVKKQEGAFEQWRLRCDQLLKETKQHATTEEECNRFINDAPYSEDYKESYKVLEK